MGEEEHLFIYLFIYLFILFYFFFFYIKRVLAKEKKIKYKKNPACRQTL